MLPTIAKGIKYNDQPKKNTIDIGKTTQQEVQTTQ